MTLAQHAYQLYVKEYLRCVKGIDDNLQRIIVYLRENDLLDSTLIVYPSDQGMLLGDPDYQEIIRSLKVELRTLREELGDTDQEYPRIRKIIKTHWDN